MRIRTQSRSVGIACKLLAGAAASLGGAAQAQWTAIRLHPAGEESSAVYALRSGQAGGYVIAPSPGGYQATTWVLATAGTTNLTPPVQGAGGSVYAMTEGSEAGLVATPTIYGHAALWHGTASSFVDLHPSNPNIFYSEAHGIRGDQQVGYATYISGATQHAALWYGSAASFVDLHPVNAVHSQALATDGTRQGGYATVSAAAGQHAALWSGTAASFTDLNPPGNFISVINGMWENQQVGWYMPFGGPQHAAIWNGTAASLIDLNPGPGMTSRLYATCGIAQAGHLQTAQGSRAAVWFGTAQSVVDLGAFLPAGYQSESDAFSIFNDNGQITVGGYARGPTGAMEAFVWVPGPGPLALWALALLGAAVRRRR